MIITLVRHGEVVEEYRGKYNGHIDIGLSQNGKLQAKELAKKLKSTAFDRVYCSDLLRAKETLYELGLTQEVIYAEQLREKSWGRHEGKSFDEIVADGIEYESFLQWLDALDGQDINEYIKDVRNYFNSTILRTKAKHILVVTHSGLIKTLLHLTNKISLQEAFSKSLPYGSYIEINVKNL